MISQHSYMVANGQTVLTHHDMNTDPLCVGPFVRSNLDMSVYI